MSYMIIDGNSLGHAASNASPLHVDGQPVHAIFHTMKMIKKAMQMWGKDYPVPIVLWDGATYWRQDEHPEYKQKPEPNTPAQEKALAESLANKAAYKAQRPTIVKMLRSLGITQMAGNGYEADDLAGYLTKFYSSRGQKVLMLTGDKDWIQLVNQNCIWYDPIRERKVDKSNFEEFTSFADPRQFVEGKGLLGDKGDNVPGIDGIGEKAAPLIMQEFGSVQGLFDAYDKFEGEYETKGDNVLPKSLSRYRKKINAFCESGREQFAFNIRMMNLLDVDLSIKDVKVVQGKANIDVFREQCENLAFKSIIREMLVWKNLFGEAA